METSLFDYNLPQELIAQTPCEVRDACKLLTLDKRSGHMCDKQFFDIIDFLEPGDLLVANETRVLPARLLGKKRGSGGNAEIFLLKELPGAALDVRNTSNSPAPSNNNSAALSNGAPSKQQSMWEALVKPGKRLKPGQNTVVDFEDAQGNIALSAHIIDWANENEKGGRRVLLSTNLGSVHEAIHKVGHTPLPPYIKNYTGNTELYQTVYSKREASAAAPTAGLHFSEELISKIKAKGITWETCELEVGIDTFRIVEEEDATKHAMHTETYTVSAHLVDTINKTKAKGGRVIAVGTTSLRSLESAWDTQTQTLRARNQERTSLYILPGYKFHVIDALITNFHVPRSTLLMLVSALGGYDHIMSAYKHAIENKYRFFSFGDAMFIY